MISRCFFPTRVKFIGNEAEDFFPTYFILWEILIVMACIILLENVFLNYCKLRQVHGLNRSTISHPRLLDSYSWVTARMRFLNYDPT